MRVEIGAIDIRGSQYHGVQLDLGIREVFLRIEKAEGIDDDLAAHAVADKR